MADDEVVLEYLVLLERHSSDLDALCVAFTGFWHKLLASQPATRPALRPAA
jgi:hypothetical protein